MDNKQLDRIGSMDCKYCGGVGKVPDFDTGAVLRAEREAAGLSRDAVATAMGISEAYLGDMERGNRLWSAERVQQYRQAIANQGERDGHQQT